MHNIELDLSKVEFSRQDLKRKIIIPAFITNELAEEIGLHVGDGHMNIYNYKVRGNYWLHYSGNIIEELDFYKNHVSNLLISLYNYKGKIFSQSDNSLLLRIRSKVIVLFKSKVIGLPLGKKNNISIPKVLFQSKEFLSNFLIGLGDTDFSLTFKKKYKDVHYYPILHLISHSKTLIDDVSNALKILGLTCNTLSNIKFHDRGKVYKRSELFISGKKNLKLWENLIGFNNNVHLTKLQIWKEFGFCPPKTTLAQRLKILEGKIEPLELEYKP